MAWFVLAEMILIVVGVIDSRLHFDSFILCATAPEIVRIIEIIEKHIEELEKKQTNIRVTALRSIISK